MVSSREPSVRWLSFLGPFGLASNKVRCGPCGPWGRQSTKVAQGKTSERMKPVSEASSVVLVRAPFSWPLGQSLGGDDSNQI